METKVVLVFVLDWWNLEVIRYNARLWSVDHCHVVHWSHHWDTDGLWNTQWDMHRCTATLLWGTHMQDSDGLWWWQCSPTEAVTLMAVEASKKQSISLDSADIHQRPLEPNQMFQQGLHFSACVYRHHWLVFKPNSCHQELNHHFTWLQEKWQDLLPDKDVGQTEQVKPLASTEQVHAKDSAI